MINIYPIKKFGCSIKCKNYIEKLEKQYKQQILNKNAYSVCTKQAIDEAKLQLYDLKREEENINWFNRYVNKNP